MQDYNSLCAAVTICSTLVNIQTHACIQRQHFEQLICKAQPAELRKFSTDSNPTNCVQSLADYATMRQTQRTVEESAILFFDHLLIPMRVSNFQLISDSTVAHRSPNQHVI